MAVLNFVRARVAALLFVALVVAGCGDAAPPPQGVVTGHFTLPGRPTSDLQRGGLNFSTGSHGGGSGHTAKVSADGAYTITLPPGSYSVIAGLAKHAGAPAESCAETINVVVTANNTTTADFVCHASPAAGG